ncbi:hypothetical protein IAT38_003723 [Cryptococcus sp. DSM 104549]
MSTTTPTPTSSPIDTSSTYVLPFPLATSTDTRFGNDNADDASAHKSPVLPVVLTVCIVVGIWCLICVYWVWSARRAIRLRDEAAHSPEGRLQTWYAPSPSLPIPPISPTTGSFGVFPSASFGGSAVGLGKAEEAGKAGEIGLVGLPGGRGRGRRGSEVNRGRGGGVGGGSGGSVGSITTTSGPSSPRNTCFPGRENGLGGEELGVGWGGGGVRERERERDVEKGERESRYSFASDRTAMEKPKSILRVPGPVVVLGNVPARGRTGAGAGMGGVVGRGVGRWGVQWLGGRWWKRRRTVRAGLMLLHE